MAYSRRVYKREAEAAEASEKAESITESTLVTTLETKIFNHKHHRKATTLEGNALPPFSTYPTKRIQILMKNHFLKKKNRKI